MPSTIHVVAKFVAKPGKEDALKAVLVGLVPPTRRELACYQYDLLVNAAAPREFCFLERWDGDRAFDQHLESAHVKKALADMESLVDAQPDIRRFTLV